jgi:hypothetical protein
MIFSNLRDWVTRLELAKSVGLCRPLLKHQAQAILQT